MPITATTICDAPTVKTYLSFNINKGYTGKNPTKRRRTTMISMPILILLSIVLIILIQDTDSIDRTIITLLIISVSLITLMWVFSLFAPKLTLKNYMRMLGDQNSFTFYERTFEVVAQTPEQQSTVTISYATLTKIYETTDYFYLYTSVAMAYIVDKRGIEGGTPEQLAALMSAQIPRGNYVVSQ